MTTEAAVLFIAAAILFGLAIWLWRRSALLVARTGAVVLGVGGVVLVILGLGARHAHKPVNVSNINNLEDPSSPRAFAAGARVVYFGAEGTLLRDGSSGSREYRVYSYDPSGMDPGEGVTRAIDDDPLTAVPHSIAVVPSNPEKLLVAEGANVRLWEGRYDYVVPSAGAAVEMAYVVGADGAGSLMLARRTAGKVGIYSINTSERTYSFEEGTEIDGDGVDYFALSDVYTWRRAAFVVSSGGRRTLYAWKGSGAADRIAVDQPAFMHPGSVVAGRLLVAGRGGGYPRIYAVEDARTIHQVVHDPSLELQDIYGITTWAGCDWALVKSGGITQLARISSREFVLYDERLGDLVVGRLKPRGFVPLSSHMGFVSDKSRFWNIRPRDKYYAVADAAGGDRIKSDYVVETLWPFSDQAIFAADGYDENDDALGVEPWVWWSHE